MTESSNISWTERRVRFVADGEDVAVWTPEEIEKTWDDQDCLVRQLLRDVLATRSALSNAKKEHEQQLVLIAANLQVFGDIIERCVDPLERDAKTHPETIVLLKRIADFLEKVAEMTQ